MISSMLKPLAIAIGLMISSSSYATTLGVQHDGMSLHELQRLHHQKGMSLTGGDDLFTKRQKSMREAALAVGAQHGYIDTMNKLRIDLNKEADVWDDLFAFKDLMRFATPGEKSLYFLPAVVQESNDVTSVADDKSRLEISGKYYEIVKRERLVTSPPDWREYLLIDLPVDASKPVGALLPKTADEQSLWTDWVAEGWEAGVLQASAEMTARIRNLGADFIGMIKYVSLVETNKITPTFVASQYRNNINQRSSLHLNQRTFAITSPAEFNGNEKVWTPLDLDPRGGFRTPDEINEINEGRQK